MKTLLSTLVVAMLFLPARGDASVVAYWRFENNLLDSSGNGLNASTAAPGFSYSTGVPGAFMEPGILPNTASYNRPNTGTAATTSVATSALLNNTFSAASFTLEAFVYLNAGGSTNFLTLLSSLESGTGISFYVGKTISGYMTGTNGAGTTSGVSFGTGLTTGAWHHVAWVGSYTPTGGSRGTAVNFYVNGVKVGGTAFYSTPAANGAALIMNSATWSMGGPANNFNGMFDELRISNQALLPSEFLIATAVPEPSSLLLIGFGCGALLWSRKGFVFRKTAK